MLLYILNQFDVLLFPAIDEENPPLSSRIFKRKNTD